MPTYRVIVKHAGGSKRAIRVKAPTKAAAEAAAKKHNGPVDK
jgi:hypothetical protein